MKLLEIGFDRREDGRGLPRSPELSKKEFIAKLNREFKAWASEKTQKEKHWWFTLEEFSKEQYLKVNKQD